MARRRKNTSLIDCLLGGLFAGLFTGITSRPVRSRYGRTTGYTRRKRGQAHYW